MKLDQVYQVLLRNSSKLLDENLKILSSTWFEPEYLPSEARYYNRRVLWHDWEVSYDGRVVQVLIRVVRGTWSTIIVMLQISIFWEENCSSKRVYSGCCLKSKGIVDWKARNQHQLLLKAESGRCLKSKATFTCRLTPFKIAPRETSLSFKLATCENMTGISR